MDIFRLSTTQKKKYLLMKKNVAWILLGVSVFLNIILVVTPLSSSHEQTKSPQQIVSDTITAVSKLVVLPADETPTVATITDLAPLAGQPFFAQAKVGDKVLIYAKAQKAILYDPSTDKVIEIAPIGNSGSGSSTTK